MVVFGWKYNMSNIEAVLLLPQFEWMEANLGAPCAGAALRRRILRHWRHYAGALHQHNKRDFNATRQRGSHNGPTQTSASPVEVLAL